MVVFCSHRTATVYDIICVGLKDCAIVLDYGHRFCYISYVAYALLNCDGALAKKQWFC